MARSRKPVCKAWKLWFLIIRRSTRSSSNNPLLPIMTISWMVCACSFFFIYKVLGHDTLCHSHWQCCQTQGTAGKSLWREHLLHLHLYCEFVPGFYCAYDERILIGLYPGVFSHSWSLLRSSCRRTASSSPLILAYNRLSSANSLICEITQSGRSLMYAINSSGPNTVPCGTPDRTLDVLLFTRTVWVQFKRNDDIQFRVLSQTP